tara:strand:+ start:363 stop:539 length:177 start_codon:yes stop_codon:yes gene_type:complete
MSSEDFVNALEKGNNLEAENAFKKDMSDRIGHSLEQKRIEVANSFVKVKKVEDDAEEV